MKKIPLLIDETSFRLGDDDEPAYVRRAITGVAKLVQEFHEDGFDVESSSELIFENVLSAIPLYDVLCGANQGSFWRDEDRDERLFAFGVLSKLRHWNDGLELSDYLCDEVQVAGEQVSNSCTICYAHAKVRAGDPCACVAVDNGHRPSGAVEIIVNNDVECIHFVTSAENSRRDYHRELPELADLDENDYIENGAWAFPTLYLVPELASQFRRFQSGYRGTRKAVTRHLQSLDDYFLPFYLECRGMPDSVKRGMATKGLSVSPESPNTRHNRKAWRERFVQLAEGEICCDWHSKIGPTSGRIHFCPNHGLEAYAGKIIVGIFADHLST